MDDVIRHWVTMAATEEAGAEGLGVSIQDRAAYFYINNGLIALTQEERLKRAFDVLTDLFNRVVLWTNMWKTVIMACQPFQMPGRMSVLEYARHVMGRGPYYQERQRKRVHCPEYGVEVAAGLLMM